MTTHATTPISTPPQPQDAERYARGSSFYTAMRIMPESQRSAMYEIYHFCRAVDDIADEEGDIAMRRAALQLWRDDIAALYQPSGNHAETSPKYQGLAQAIATFHLRKEDFLAVIDGMQMDLNGPIVAPDLATLMHYCDRVACAVGRLSACVFGLKPDDGIELAHHLGNALQLTNILRDIDEDAAIDRLYLPREYLDDAGINTSDISAIITHPNLPMVCERLAHIGKAHFAKGNEVMLRYPHKIVRTPRVMSEAYRAIYDAVIKRGFAAPRAPIKLNKFKLVVIVLKNLIA